MSNLKNMLKFPLSADEIEKLQTSDTESLVTLDKAGLLIGCNEDITAYKKRLKTIESEILNLKTELKNHGKIELFHKIYAKDRDLISLDIISEASRYTEDAYSFSIYWAPGFFLSSGLGLLTGGCSASSENGFTFFLIRSAFSKKSKWLWYTRDELLSHELCHAGRDPIKDRHLEEFFAYKLSSSPFRRFFGNCFQGAFDAVLLLLPLFLLLSIQIVNTFLHTEIPILYFWAAAAIYPFFLIVRNRVFRNYYYKAKISILSAFGEHVKYDSILFRCNSDEIKRIGKYSPEKLKDWIHDRAKKELRWQVINKRFINT